MLTKYFMFTVVVKFSPPTPWIYPVQEIFDAFEFVWDDFWKLSKKALSNSGGKGTKLANHGKFQSLKSHMTRQPDSILDT